MANKSRTPIIRFDDFLYPLPPLLYEHFLKPADPAQSFRDLPWLKPRTK